MKTLFFSLQSRIQLVLVCIGLLIGITLLLLTVQLYHSASEYDQKKELLNENTLVVQKKTGRAAHLGLGDPNFTKGQISELLEKDFIAECSPIISNQFDVVVQINDPVIPAFNSSIYIQSVDPEFLDVSTNEYNWDPSIDFVPIVMPRNFLVMLNTFLSASQLPQLSEKLVSNVQMSLRIGSGNNTQSIKARIVGFTNAFSSILAPKEFIVWANSKFSKDQQPIQSQLVVKAGKGKFGVLESYLKKNGFESAEEQLLLGRLKSVLSLVLGTLLGTALLCLLLSLFIMLQYLQLTLANRSYEIRTMLRLGHSINYLKYQFVKYFGTLLTILSIISWCTFYAIKIRVNTALLSAGILIEDGVSIWSIVCIFVVFITFILAINHNAYSRIQAQFQT